MRAACLANRTLLYVDIIFGKEYRFTHLITQLSAAMSQGFPWSIFACIDLTRGLTRSVIDKLLGPHVNKSVLT